MNAKIVRNVLLLLVLAVPAVTFALLLKHKSHTVPESLHQRVTALLAQLSEADVRWNENVLKARLSMAGSQDSVLAKLEQQVALADQLESTLKPLTRLQPALASELAGYRATINEKSKLVTQFRSGNSALNSSVSGFSSSVGVLLQAIASSLPTSPAAAASLSRIEGHLQELLAGLLEFTALPRGSSLAGVKHKLLDIDEELHIAGGARQLPNAIVEKLGIALDYVSALLREKPAVDQMLAAVVDVPTSQSLASVKSTYQRLHDFLAQRQGKYRTLLYGYLVVLGLVLVYLVLRWHNQSRMTLLKSVNRQLEQHVNKRTEELSQAYEELKQSQGRLVQSEKMSALGQLVAGVAHEINTPLAYSRSNVEMVTEQMAEVRALIDSVALQAELLNADPADGDKLHQQIGKTCELGQALHEDGIGEEMEELLKASGSGLDQISEMVMSLKDFSRVDRRKVERFDLNKGLESALLIAKNKLKHKVTVTKNYGDIPAVTCAPSQINQVFLNMLVNAAQAMEAEGELTLTTEANGDHIDVIIEDNGKGIPDDALPSIFDPFFTTKDIGEGTGLGLSICYQIIEQHGGTISVDSKVGVGTRFIISLFISEDEAELTQRLNLEDAA